MPEVELPKPEELEEIKAKAFTRRVALITGIFAVILAISHLGGDMATKEDAHGPAAGFGPMGLLPGQEHPRAYRLEPKRPS